MYPNFHKAALAIASQDKKGVWNRWLDFGKPFNFEDLECLFQEEVHPVFFSCALAMMIAPDPKRLAKHVGWIIVGIKYDNPDHSDLIDRECIKESEYRPRVLKNTEKLVLALLRDLAPRQTLTPKEVRSWRICEHVIGLLLLDGKNIDDPSAIELMRYIRFYTTEALENMDSPNPFYTMTCLMREYRNQQWVEFLWTCMEYLVELEIAGKSTVFRPQDCIPLSMLFVHALCVSGEFTREGDPPADMLERIKFAADRGLLATYHSKFHDYSPLFLAKFVQDPEVLYSVALNFLATEERDADSEYDECNLKQIDRLWSVVELYGDDDIFDALCLRAGPIRERLRLAEKFAAENADMTPYQRLIEEMMTLE